MATTRPSPGGEDDHPSPYQQRQLELLAQQQMQEIQRAEEDIAREDEVERTSIGFGVTAAQLVTHLHNRGYAHVITCRLTRNISNINERSGGGPIAIMELIPLPGLLADAINESMTLQRDAKTGRKPREPQIPVDPSISNRGFLGVRWKELRSHHNYVDRYAIGEGGQPVLGAKASMQCALFQFGSMLNATTFIAEYNVTDNVRVELRSSRLVWYFSHGVELFRMDIRYSDIADIAIISPETGEDKRRRVMLTILLRRPARVMKKSRRKNTSAVDARAQQRGQDSHRWDITTNERFDRCVGDFSGVGQLGSSLVYRFALDPVSQFTNLRGDSFESCILGHFVTRYLHQMGLLRTPEQAKHCGKPHSLQPLTVMRPPNVPPYIPVSELTGVRFLVAYWLEVCISHGTFSRYQVTREVQAMLQSKVVAQAEAIAALRALYNTRLYIPDLETQLAHHLHIVKGLPEELLDPAMARQLQGALAKPTEGDRSTPYFLVPRILVTPVRTTVLPPEVDTGNRLLRKYTGAAGKHCFLRVSFTEEDGSPLNMSADQLDNTEAFTRVRNVCQDGVQLGKRRYVFLASSNSQYRTFGAWLYAQVKAAGNMTPSEVRATLGNISTIRPVAKAAARLAQALTTTIATVTVHEHEAQEIPDIERNGYCFSDGCGTLSPDLAERVADCLAAAGRIPEDFVPSAFQIRWRGCKGMLTVDTKLRGMSIKYRPSMHKFEGSDQTLGVCSSARFMPAFLNQDIITLISSRGAPDQAFLHLQRLQLDQLKAMVHDGTEAQKVLRQYEGENNPMFAKLAQLVGCGYPIKEEPLLAICLGAIQAWMARDMRNKTHVYVEEGCRLLGVMDETKTLQPGQIFAQVQRHRDERPVVLEGPVIVTRNPCLHPGDVLCLEAVNVPELRYLVNVAVFPQLGNRPHCNEASGGDFDGDDYFISWHKPIVDKLREAKPMDVDAMELAAAARLEAHAQQEEETQRKREQPQLRRGTSSGSLGSRGGRAGTPAFGTTPLGGRQGSTGTKSDGNPGNTGTGWTNGAEGNGAGTTSHVENNEPDSKEPDSNGPGSNGTASPSPALTNDMEPFPPSTPMDGFIDGFVRLPRASSSSSTSRSNGKTPSKLQSKQSTQSKSTPKSTTIMRRKEGDGLTGQDLSNNLVEFAQNNLLGRICNTHRALSDQKTKGAMEIDCQLLAWLAAKAVDWPKTGVWKEEDTKLFEIINRQVGQYPDFMNRPYRSTYKSDRVLGKMFRDPVLQKLLTESADLRKRWAAGTHARLTYDPDLMVEGWKSYVPAAQLAQLKYSSRMLGLMNQFGEFHEGSLVTGLLMRSRNDLRRSEYETRERCVEQVTALQHEFLQEFMKEFATQENTPTVQRFKRAKASAWYRVAYDLKYSLLPPAPPISPGREGSGPVIPRQFFSFGWIPYEILIEIKQEKLAEKKQPVAVPSEPARAVRSSVRGGLEDVFAARSSRIKAN